MRRFGENDYYRNKRRNEKSKGIVYEFADETSIEITFEEYLKSNPDKTKSDYLEIKKLSDENYDDQSVGESTNSRVGKRLLQAMWSKRSEWNNDGYTESKTYGNREKQELYKDAEYLLSKLTEKQKRQYLMHNVDGMTIREIATKEGCRHQAIHQNIKAAERKIETLYKEMLENQRLEDE